MPTPLPCFLSGAPAGVRTPRRHFRLAIFSVPGMPNPFEFTLGPRFPTQKRKKAESVRERSTDCVRPSSPNITRLWTAHPTDVIVVAVPCGFLRRHKRIAAVRNRCGGVVDP